MSVPGTEHVAQAGPFNDPNEVADMNEAAQATQATEVRQPC